MNYDLEGKVFRSVMNTGNGNVGSETRFFYHQQGRVVWAEYRGGTIARGHLIARVLDDWRLDMRYHHLNQNGELMLGHCFSTPEVLPDGRLKFKEAWQWLSGDMSNGYSEIEEVRPGDHGEG